MNMTTPKHKHDLEHNWHDERQKLKQDERLKLPYDELLKLKQHKQRGDKYSGHERK